MSFVLAIALAATAGFADLDAIDRQVGAFTGVAIGEPGGANAPIDRRLRLKPCASALALGWNTQRRDTVVVRCPDAGGWRLFVPVIGIPSATAAAPAPSAVNRGDSVTIAVSGDGFTVSQPGEALEAGPVGAWIRVRTVRAAARSPADGMRARIVRPGMVEVELP
jgi:flagella basal body P-ring formation protein FlgA